MLITIGSVDITQYIQESTYKVDKDDVFEEWVDGNWIKHRGNVRTRVNGSFELVFVTNQTFNDFLTLINSNQDSNKLLTLTAHISNKNTNEQVQVFYDLKTLSDRKISDAYVYKRFSMSIEEA